LLLGCADQFGTDPAWVKKSIAELQKRFWQGMEFFVVAPTFQTLRQQTLERIVKAGLAQGDSEDVVNPYSWASKASCFLQSAVLCEICILYLIMCCLHIT